MLILLVGIAQAKAFMLHLTSPPPRNDIKAVSQHIHCWQHGVLTSTAWHRHKSGNARPCWSKRRVASSGNVARSEEHTSELQSQSNLVCRLLLEKKKNTNHAT